MNNVAQPTLFRWQKALRSSDLAPSQRLVALMLSTYMSVQGEEAFPSLPTLAHDTGLSERAVRYAIRALEAGGWLTTTTRRNPRGDASSNRYVAVIPCTQCPTLGHSLPHHVEQSNNQLPSGEELRSSPSSRAPSGRTVEDVQMATDRQVDDEFYGAPKKGVPRGPAGRVRAEFYRMFGDRRPVVSSAGKMGQNIKWLLEQGYTEEVILESFKIFKGMLPSLAIGPHLACWDAYFQKKGTLMKQAAFATMGGGSSSDTTTAGEAALERQRRRKERDGSVRHEG